MKTYLKEGLKNLSQQKGKIDNVFRKISPRTTIISNMNKLTQKEQPKRSTNLEIFQNFVNKALPKMEQDIEKELISNFLKKVDNETAREYIIQAYEQRQITIKYGKISYEQHLTIEDNVATSLRPSYQVETQVKLTEQDENDVGFFLNLDIEKIKQDYPYGLLGDYQESQFKYTSKFSLQSTETSIKLINEFRKIKANNVKNIQIKKVDYEKIKNQSKETIEEIIYDEELYNLIFHDFSKTMIDVYKQKFRDSQVLEKLFSSPLIFDFLINLMIRKLSDNTFQPYITDKQKRYNIFVQILSQIDENLELEYANASKIKEFVNEMKEFTFNLNQEQQFKIDLLIYEKNYLKLPLNMKKFGLKDFLGINSGVLLNGDSGTGKSSLLMLCSQFAYENNWIVIQVPNCKELTQTPTVVNRENFSGLYSQQEFAQKFLQNFKISNPQIQQMPVNMDLYGFYSSHGKHQEDPDSAPNIYNKERQVFFKDFESIYYPNEQLYLDEQDRLLKFYTLKIKLSQPQNLMDIVDKGIEQKELAVCAVYELLEQIYNQESHCVMILVDEYNYLFKNSINRSFRYANTNNSYIPPYHLSLCRAFLKFDGHLIKNGVKICASSVKSFHNHEFGPKQIMLPEKGYNIKMEGLQLNDFRNFLEYLYQNNLWHANSVDTDFHQQFWMECQGNIGQALRAINFNLREMGW